MIVLVAVFTRESTFVSGQSVRLGEFDGHADVGSPKIAGSAAYNPISQEYSLAAAGVNMWAARDEFHFVWKRMTGDFILQTRVQFLGKGVDAHRKAGLIVRSTLEADSPYVDGIVHGDGLTSLQFRRTKGAITEERPSTIKGADVIQLERKGNTYTLSAAKFGEPFTATEIPDIDLGDEVLVGSGPLLAQRRRRRNGPCSATCASSGRQRTASSPYRDYIGSVLELLDVQTGRRQIVHRSEQPFEAPNWTRDGGSLVYNTSGRSEGRGRLYRFDLATRTADGDRHGFVKSQQQRSRPVVRRHDARDQRSERGRQSAVYTVPIGGGTPKRITPLTPSYLHGWSPDGKSLVYTGGRNKRIRHLQHRRRRRAVPRSGSPTSKAWTTDRSSRRTASSFTSIPPAAATMQIWRMKPDGKDPEQVTDDEFNNWFPHISPDGQWIAFISFPKDVDPSDHPLLQTGLPAADAASRRRAEGDRLRVRRPGHDQRAIVVTRQQDAGVRQQHGHVPEGERRKEAGGRRPHEQKIMLSPTVSGLIRRLEKRMHWRDAGPVRLTLVRVRG